MSRTDDVDLDRLADYTAGVLDAREHRRVEELLASDPEWRRAHAALHAAQPRLDAALAGLRGPALPADVATRLDAALAGAAGTGTVIDLSARRRRRRVAVATVAAVAAAVVGFGGVAAVLHGSNRSSSSTSARAPAVGVAPQLGTAAPVQRYSGTDYTPQNLPDVLGQGGAAAAAGSMNPDAKAPAGAAADNELNRLTAPDALAQCLAAVVSRYGGSPVLVDYARFQGQPALVVVLTGDSSRRIVVVGPNCGSAGPATLYDTTQ